jgi:chemotaxis protein CheD
MMVQQVYLKIGEYYITQSPTVITTVLGSCVGVCLFDKKERIGALNHILLPGDPDLNYFNDSARYGVNSMELLINGIMKLGGKKKNIIAKAFGGACVTEHFSCDNGPGEQNVKFVTEFLKNEGIKMVGHDLGGYDIRKILLKTDTGDVFLKRLNSSLSSKISRIEKQRLKTIDQKIINSEPVTLF